VIRLFADRVVGLDASEHAQPFIEAKGYDQVVISGLESVGPTDIGLSDAVIAMDVLEHLRDDVAGIRAIRCLLKPGGHAIVTVPAFPFLWGLQDDVSLHYRRYRMTNLCSILEAEGFRIIRRTYFNAVLFLPIFAARRLMRIFHIRSVQSEGEINNPLINAILKAIFLSEIALIRRGIRLPFGVSALVVAERIETNVNI
jgi:SAM-dependent methyltransferase